MNRVRQRKNFIVTQSIRRFVLTIDGEKKIIKHCEQDTKNHFVRCSQLFVHLKRTRKRLRVRQKEYFIYIYNFMTWIIVLNQFLLFICARTHALLWKERETVQIDNNNINTAKITALEMLEGFNVNEYFMGMNLKYIYVRITEGKKFWAHQKNQKKRKKQRNANQKMSTTDWGEINDSNKKR